MSTLKSQTGELFFLLHSLHASTMQSVCIESISNDYRESRVAFQLVYYCIHPNCNHIESTSRERTARDESLAY